MQRMAHDSGQRATAAAAAKTGTLMTVSNISTVSLEDVTRAGGPGGARWFQLFFYKLRERFRISYINSSLETVICNVTMHFALVNLFPPSS